ncbi:MAG TPA: PE-PPE domain-containing protein [Mycobacterium sp.]|nr:PE-PPE domain-containing protein [Mycobacterium sp.]
MIGSGSGSPGSGLLSAATAGVVAMTAITSSSLGCRDVVPEIQVHAVRLTSGDTVGFVMGGSGIPLPNFNIPGYVDAANSLYIQPTFPDTEYPTPLDNGLFTPEYPVLSMPFSLNYPDATTGPLAGFPDLSTSMGQGMLILENAIKSMPAGDTATVFGWSQSSTISSLVMQQLDPSGAASDLPVQFVLIGDPSAPNGGILERFDGLTMPSLGLSADGATPVGSFPTDIFTLEYDGWADFPKYPINFLSDLNAFLGMMDIHGLYLSSPAAGGPSPAEIATAMANPLPGSAVLDAANGLTNYYMIPETPPLVSLLGSIPIIGQALESLLGPDLTLLINLGYGDGSLGYSLPANVPTGIGLFPAVSLTTVLNELVAGAEKGVTAMMGDLSHLSVSPLLPSASSPLSSLTDLFTGLAATAADPSAALPGITDISDALAGIGAIPGTLLMQTVDVLDAVVVSMPAYDISLFTDNLADPLNAIGLPIAADVALLTMAAGFEFELVDGAVTAAVNEIAGLF